MRDPDREEHEVARAEPVAAPVELDRRMTVEDVSRLLVGVDVER